MQKSLNATDTIYYLPDVIAVSPNLQVDRKTCVVVGISVDRVPAYGFSPND